MPLFVYVPEDASADEGVEVERFFHSTPPNMILVHGVPHVRTSVVRVAVQTGLSRRSQGDEVLAGYHAQECSLGSRFRSRYTPEEIKSAWRDDSLSAQELAEDHASGTVNEAAK